MSVPDYNIKKSEAQRAADSDGFDRGIEKLGSSFRVFMLPRKENRCGHELRCEVVYSMRPQPGHGY